MNLPWKISLGILSLFALVSADIEKAEKNLDKFCQALKCNSTTEICLWDSKCDQRVETDLSKCVYCSVKENRNENPVSERLLASSRFNDEASLPIASRLLAKSGGTRLLADNLLSLSTSSMKSPLAQENRTSDELTFDDYYEYDEDETSDKNDLGEEDDYLDDYAEPIENIFSGTEAIRKLGVCPKITQSTNDCDSTKILQSDCRFDTDCPSDLKCCEAACGKRLCNKPIKASGSVCPTSFTCALNCRLGYRTDSNGCLLCECQTCPSMSQCQKNCPSGYLKDLFGCEICECIDQCPPFHCDLVCPSDVGYVKSKNGCPLCQCASITNKIPQSLSSCQNDVHCPPGFRCLNDAHNVPMCQAAVGLEEPGSIIEGCPDTLLKNCNLDCPDGNYLLDSNGCPTCACAVPSIPKCPLIKCRANCEETGYALDENGCQTCHCAAPKAPIPMKPKVECSRVMCRMFCVHGFRRDENGCEICKCNDSPQPCPQWICENTCPNGYRKDYNGCPTCSCEERQRPPVVDKNGCTQMKCDLNCKYGYERDQMGCQLCSCNRCPLQSCRMFCVFGFKKNSDGCDVCECNWEPVAENIPCSERIPCTGNRVCNTNLGRCELVSADKVNWFVYNFNIQSNLFRDPEFLQTFTRGLINNIAAKYGLETGQITVSSVEPDGTTSFQIMPYNLENAEDFQKKMDRIDLDLNSQEFRSVLPSVARDIERNRNRSRGNTFLQRHPRLSLYLTAVSLGMVALVIAGMLALTCRRRRNHPTRSDSKVPICDASYHQAPTEDDHYHAVHAPDGTAYVVVESEDMTTPNDKRALV